MIIARDLDFPEAVKAARLHNAKHHKGLYLARPLPTQDPKKIYPVPHNVVCLICDEPDEATKDKPCRQR